MSAVHAAVWAVCVAVFLVLYIRASRGMRATAQGSAREWVEHRASRSVMAWHLLAAVAAGGVMVALE